MMLSPVRILLLVVLVLCAELASLWVDQQGHWRNINWTVPVAKAPDIMAPVVQSFGVGGAGAPSYASIQERPLFAPDRRPPPPPPPPAPPDPLANFQLHGILTGDNAGILARIDGKVRRIKLNDKVGGWTLKSIEGRQATFVQDGVVRPFQMAYAKLNTVTPLRASPAPSGQMSKPALPVANDPKSYYREELRKRNELNAARGLPIQLE